jgi:hypothetical protein
MKKNINKLLKLFKIASSGQDVTSVFISKSKIKIWKVKEK